MRDVTVGSLGGMYAHLLFVAGVRALDDDTICWMPTDELLSHLTSIHTEVRTLFFHFDRISSVKSDDTDPIAMDHTQSLRQHRRPHDYR